MKKFFGKRWHSIPVALVSALLVLTLIGGGVLAVVIPWTVWGGTGTVTVVEAFTVTNRDGDGDEEFTGAGTEASPAIWNVTMLPGETRTLNLLVHNASSVPLSVGVVHDIDGPSTDVTFEYGGGGEILAGADQQVALVVYIGGNAATGDYIITFAITRE